MVHDPSSLAHRLAAWPSVIDGRDTMTIRFQVIPGTNLFLDLDPDEFRAIVQQFTEVAEIIAQTLIGGADVDALRARVSKLAQDVPLYQGLEDWTLI